jgi:hypothetical protein
MEGIIKNIVIYMTLSLNNLTIELVNLLINKKFPLFYSIIKELKKTKN